MALGDFNIQLPDFVQHMGERIASLAPEFMQAVSSQAPRFGGGDVQGPAFGGGGSIAAPSFGSQQAAPAAPNFQQQGGLFNGPQFGAGAGLTAPNFNPTLNLWTPQRASQYASTDTSLPKSNSNAPGANGAASAAEWGGAATADDNQGLTADQVNKWIGSVHSDSPLNGMGQFIIDTANKYGVSVPLMLGIMQKESGLGTNVGVGNLTGIKNAGGEGFANTGNWQQSIEATAANLATSTYKGKSIAEQIGAWYVGPEAYKAQGMAAVDSTGGKNGTVQDYVNLVLGVYHGLGKDVNATQGGTMKAGSGGTSVIQAGEKLLGTPYMLGGLRSHPGQPQAGIDCSEFTAYAYQQLGVQLPWNAQAQFNQTQRVDKSQLQVGDLVFFTNTYDAGETVTHVGIFAGYQNGHPVMLNSSNDGVSYQQLDSQYWKDHYYGAGRVARPA